MPFPDIHGNYNLWTQIKNYYKEKDILIFLGDAIDRGPDSIKILQEMLNDERVIFLLGNHEQMLLNYANYGIHQALHIEKEVIQNNGSYLTLLDFLKLTTKEQIELIDKLKNKTYMYYIYINKEKKNIFLSHAGLSVNNLYNFEKNDLLWNRDHIKQDKNWNNKFKHWYIVHGHSPVQLINPNKVIIEIYRYFNNHKIDLDICTTLSKTIAVLNLDTLQVKYFKENDNDETRDNE